MCVVLIKPVLLAYIKLGLGWNSWSFNSPVPHFSSFLLGVCFENPTTSFYSKPLFPAANPNQSKLLKLSA